MNINKDLAIEKKSYYEGIIEVIDYLQSHSFNFFLLISSILITIKIYHKIIMININFTFICIKN